MSKIIINRTNGEVVPPSSPLFIGFRESRKNGMCCEVCPEPPYYKCTRAKGHEKSRKGTTDHAAHGADGQMYARWE